MRKTLLIIIISIAIVSCGKDKFTTNPQISFKSVSPNALRSDVANGSQVTPKLIIHMTDAEGDVGFIPGKDTGFIFIKTLLNNRDTVFHMPDIRSVVTKNFQGDLIIEPPFVKSSRPAPKVDTLFYEIYVMDFAKHKSNTIRTSDPVLFIIPQ